MNIQDYPGVQILGLNATVREGNQYIHLGMYNLDGSFEWSPEGLLRRDGLLKEEVKEPEPVAEPATSEDKLEADLADARARNEARRKKARSR